MYTSASKRWPLQTVREWPASRSFYYYRYFFEIGKCSSARQRGFPAIFQEAKWLTTWEQHGTRGIGGCGWTALRVATGRNHVGTMMVLAGLFHVDLEKVGSNCGGLTPLCSVVAVGLERMLLLTSVAV
eukprot:COSAG02_NODE_5123_length_4611_cov_5.961879_2_plen_128_part_00